MSWTGTHSNNNNSHSQHKRQWNRIEETNNEQKHEYKKTLSDNVFEPKRKKQMTKEGKMEEYAKKHAGGGKGVKH